MEIGEFALRRHVSYPFSTGVCVVSPLETGIMNVFVYKMCVFEIKLLSPNITHIVLSSLAEF